MNYLTQIFFLLLMLPAAAFASAESEIELSLYKAQPERINASLRLLRQTIAEISDLVRQSQISNGVLDLEQLQRSVPADNPADVPATFAEMLKIRETLRTIIVANGIGDILVRREGILKEDVLSTALNAVPQDVSNDIISRSKVLKAPGKLSTLKFPTRFDPAVAGWVIGSTLAGVLFHRVIDLSQVDHSFWFFIGGVVPAFWGTFQGDWIIRSRLASRGLSFQTLPFRQQVGVLAINAVAASIPPSCIIGLIAAAIHVSHQVK